MQNGEEKGEGEGEGEWERDKNIAGLFKAM